MLTSTGVRSRASTRPERGSTRRTSGPRPSQSEPDPTASGPASSAPGRTRSVRSTRPLRSPISATRGPAASATQSPLAARRHLARRERERERRHDAPAPGVHPDEPPAAVEQHPHGAPGHERVVRPGRQADPAHEPARARVDRGEGVGSDAERGPGGRVVRAGAEDDGRRGGHGDRAGRRQQRARRAAAAAAARRRAARRAPRAPARRSSPGGRPGPWRAPPPTTASSAGGSSGGGDETRRGLVEVRVEHGDLGLAHERRLAGQALEEHAAERVRVGAARRAGALDLLRRDVGDRADEHALAGQALGARVCWRARSRHEPAPGRPADEDVRRLDVAVDEPGGMRRVERRRRLPTSATARSGSSGPSRRRRVAQVAAVDPRHRDEQHAAVLAGVEHRDDARVLQDPGDAASRRNRSRKRASVASSRSSTFSATVRPPASPARYTAPVAPSPSSSPMR